MNSDANVIKNIHLKKKYQLRKYFDFVLSMPTYTVCYRKTLSEEISFSRSMVGAVIGEIECKLQLFGRHKEFRSRSSSETHRGLDNFMGEWC